MLERLLASRFSRVAPDWAGDTAVLLGGGPSLSNEQIVEVRYRCAGDSALRCIAVNDAYLLAPFADAIYFADSHWWKWQIEGRPKEALGMNAQYVREAWKAFPGQRCTIENSGANVTDESVHMLRNQSHPHHSVGLSLDSEVLVTGRSSGFQALNLAVLAGAKTILLCGYDGQPDREGKKHWFGDHERPTPAAFFPEMRSAFTLAEKALQDAGVRIINCSPGSAINSFERMELAEALKLVDEEATA